MIDGDFLDTVITTSEGWFQLLVGHSPNLSEEWYRWPGDRDRIIRRAAEVDGNVYFSAHLFTAKKSTKEHAIPSRTLVVDLDNADVSDLKFNPTVMVETSPDRHQGYWVLRNVPENFESLSKRLSYTIENADHSGWPVGHKFRVPNTRNYKYDPSPMVRIVPALSSERIYGEEEISQWVDTTNVDAPELVGTDKWIEQPHTSSVGPRELIEKYRSEIGPKVFSYFDSIQLDRSEALWALMVALFRAKATRDEVYWIASHSANNKFKDRRYNAERDLAKDVDRAEKAQSTQQSDITHIVRGMEKTGGSENDRKRSVTRTIMQDLLRRGEFVSTTDQRRWFMFANAGMPVELVKRSSELDALLQQLYGMNPSDGYQPFVINHLISHTITRGREARSAVLSHYAGSSVLLHGGRKDVYRITTDSVTRHTDGSFGILFPWRRGEELISLDDPIADDWVEWIFEGWFDNLVDFSPEQAKALIRIWFLFILFRDDAVSRPIVAALGQQGSGKTAFFHFIYTILYGKNKSLNALSSQEDFDFLTAQDPLVLFDNVDSFIPWLPDRLALGSSASDWVRRKLYTDNDVVTLKRQAILGLSAHEPKFLRPDVVDRLLVFNFSRRDKFRPESPMLDRIHNNRAQIWGAIVRDVQAVLRTSNVNESDIPNFRISDFARVGARIAVALGILPQFKEVLDIMRKVQVALTLGDDVLINALEKWVVRPSRNGKTPEFVTPSVLHDYMTSMDASFRQTYRTSSVLAKRLMTMEPNLKSLFKVDREYNATTGTWTWKFESL